MDVIIAIMNAVIVNVAIKRMNKVARQTVRKAMSIKKPEGHSSGFS